jgi:hypothetical protein
MTYSSKNRQTPSMSLFDGYVGDSREKDVPSHTLLASGFAGQTATSRSAISMGKPSRAASQLDNALNSVQNEGCGGYLDTARRNY